MTSQGDKHLGLSSQCGICADIIFRHERVIAIIGNDDSTSFGGCTRPFAYPQMGHSITTVDGFSLCRRLGCNKCASSLEFVPIHHDCYSIFVQECRLDSTDAKRWLWLRCAWRKPWRAARPLYLSTRQIGDKELPRIAEICGVPQLSCLPQEIIDMIRDYSLHSLFWRSFSAIRLASSVERLSPEPPHNILLSQVLSWERHGVLERVLSSSPSPFIRLTIDSDGINKVERLSSAPVYSGECSTHDRFILQHESRLDGVEAQVQDGLLRLKLPESRQMLPIWNTYAPPDLSSCRAFIPKFPSWQHFHAVEADCINGITFFFSQGHLFGTHIHYFKKSSATSTYERFSNRRQKGIVWIYLPIAKGDRLLVLGIREGPLSEINILARTRQVGDIVIGRNITGKVRDRCLSKSAPVTIVYGEPEEGLPVQLFGAYSRTYSQPPLPRPFPLEKSFPNPLGDGSYFSWAPLQGISSTLTFNGPDGRCRGIMFQYQNGGQRTVGQCRLYVDSVVRETHPDSIQFRVQSISSRWDRQLYAVHAKFGRYSEEQQVNEGWECKPLKGFVQFWFTEGSSYLAIGN